MSRYTADENQRIRLKQLVRDWTGSGLLASSQAALLEPNLHVDLRRTGVMLRIGLALFTLLAAGAAVILTFISLGFRDDGAAAIMCLVLGAAAFGLADTLVAQFRLYRYGVEEALVVVAVVLFGIGGAISVDSLFGSSHGSIAVTVGLIACAAVSAAAYARFGFQYAAVAAVSFISLVPSAFGDVSQPIRRLLVCAASLLAFVVMRARSRSSDDTLADDASMVAALSMVGGYLAINVHIDLGVLGIWSRPSEPWFRWTSYALTIVIPVFAFWRGMADRDRRVMRAALATALMTLVTNKLYLGWPRQTWDPMLFGLFLMLTAAIVRRWLASGPDGVRNGFTPARILQSDTEGLRLASLASAAIHLNPDRPPVSQQPDTFSGGRSGGAGAGADF